MNIISIDCCHITCREDFHDTLAHALTLPAWYGRNLDALHDCLTAISDDTVLHLQSWSTAEDALGRYAAAAKKALTHAEEANSCLHVKFE